MPSILLLLAIWLGVALAVRMVSSGKPSAAATLALVEARPAAGADPETLHAWIGRFSSRLAGLELDARHRVLMDPRLRAAFAEMPAAGQTHFLAGIETPGWKEFIEGTKRWNGGRCVRLMQPALADLDRLEPGSAARFRALLVVDLAVADPAVEQVGIDGIFRGTDPLTRFDARPFIERIQKYSQRGR